MTIGSILSIYPDRLARFVRVRETNMLGMKNVNVVYFLLQACHKNITATLNISYNHRLGRKPSNDLLLDVLQVTKDEENYDKVVYMRKMVMSLQMLKIINHATLS